MTQSSLMAPVLFSQDPSSLHSFISINWGVSAVQKSWTDWELASFLSGAGRITDLGWDTSFILLATFDW